MYLRRIETGGSRRLYRGFTMMISMLGGKSGKGVRKTDDWLFILTSEIQDL
jgi:hypothetical protein